MNSRIANVKCLKTDTDPKKRAFLIHLILILEPSDVLRSHFTFSLGELKTFKCGIVIFPADRRYVHLMTLIWILGQKL